MAIVKKIFIVVGMHCGSCAVSIGMILKSLIGVKSARVDYDTRRAEIEYDDTEVGPTDMGHAIASLGYRLEEWSCD